jgi:nicotinamide-nucleotide amidase
MAVAGPERLLRPGGEVELVAVGDELLLGDTVDTNGTWLGQRLAAEGFVVVRRTVVGDHDAAIQSAVGDALARTGVVLVTGGLGPTQDDLTRPAIARLYGWPLEIDNRWLDVIRARFEARGRTMPEVNRVQAEVPRGAELLANERGTAPGLLLDDPERGLTILLPGVPGELRWLFEQWVIHLLRARVGGAREPVRSRTLRTTGLPESEVAERIADVVDSLHPLTIAFLPVGIGIDLRITSWGDGPADQIAYAMERAEQRIRERLGAYVYGADGDDLAEVVGRQLAARGQSIGVAESCTGGLLMKRLTDAGGASHWASAGIVSYSNEAKTELLGVDPVLIATHGAVSEAVAYAMLDGIHARTGADAALSITGIAGPAGGTPDKPVGTVWIGASLGSARTVHRHLFPGTRAEIRERSVQAALAVMLALLREADA